METSTAFQTSTNPYQYQPLSEEAGEVRLLILLPGPFSSRPHVELQNMIFEEGHPKEFEALSYTWGSEKDPCGISVGPDLDTLAVTQNLAEALLYLRYEDKPRILWIDAICVNQKDLAERSSQVKRMADIYRNASRVIVWLGPESEDSSIAFDAFNRICSNVRVDWAKYSMSPISGNTLLPLDEFQLFSIQNLLSRSWFERLWIWQEIRLGSANSIVICGSQIIPWNNIRDSVHYLFVNPIVDISSSGEAFAKSISSVFQLCDYSRSPDFIFLLNQTKKCKCSDPRDKGFALLSLLTKHQGIQPDYTKSLTEVCQDAALSIIACTCDLEVLAAVELDQEGLDMPSWVLNWSHKRVSEPLNHHSYNAGTVWLLDNIRVHFQSSILQVTGVSVSQFNLPLPAQL